MGGGFETQEKGTGGEGGMVGEGYLLTIIIFLFPSTRSSISPVSDSACKDWKYISGLPSASLLFKPCARCIWFLRHYLIARLFMTRAIDFLVSVDSKRQRPLTLTFLYMSLPLDRCVCHQPLWVP